MALKVENIQYHYEYTSFNVFQSPPLIAPMMEKKTHTIKYKSRKYAKHFGTNSATHPF